MTSLIAEFSEFTVDINLYRRDTNQLNYIDTPSYVAYALNCIIQEYDDQDTNYNSKRNIPSDKSKITDINVFSAEKLLVSNQENNIIGDRIIYEGNLYEIVSAIKWLFDGKSYYKHIASYCSENIDYLVNNSTPSPLPLPNTPNETITPIQIFNEVAGGTLDGINLVFTSAYDFIYNSLVVNLNGQRLVKDEQYTKVSDNSIELIAELVPIVDDIVTFDYFKKL